MEEKVTQAADNPAAAADQAPKDSSSQAPSVDAEQGAGTTAAPEHKPQHDSDTGDTAETPSREREEPHEAQEEQGPESTAHAAPQSEAPADASVTSESDNAGAEAMTMEDVMAAEGDQLARKPIHRGTTTTGTIIMLSQEGVVVDVGAKIEGVIPYNQLFEFDVNASEAAKYFKPGDEIQVYVVRADIPNSTIILSKKRADQERAWNLLHDIFEKKLPVEVEIVEKVRGGLVANLGVRAFLPASQVDVRRVSDLSPYVGKRLKVKIIELNRKRNRVIISRRAIVEEEIAEQKDETLKRLEPGAKLEGEVVEITDFGVFVNLGGVDGLVHRSELTHGRFNHPREVVELGQKVKVEVLDMDLERERINLSMKRLAPNPWENVLAKYHIGQKVSGKVTNLTPFGAFVEIEPGLEGLIHVSEMSWTKRVRHPKEIVSEGDEVEAMILKIDTNQQRISLGLRQTQPDPWSSLPDRFPPGTEVTGPITGITEFGVFMEIEEGIEGLVHISELAHEHIENISEHFSRGDEITAVILNIDPIEQRASLSRKRLLPYTASGDMESAPMGAPQSRGGGRKGRRGGRRSAGIDYDYSYAATDAGAKTTTKLGDVYADLFAQFGLTDKQEKKAQEAEAKKNEGQQQEVQAAPVAEAQEQAPEAEAQALQAEPTEAVTSEGQAEGAEDKGEEAAKRLEAQVPARPEASKDEDVDPENAIDAAEAAALLTAAFRQGRRPVAEQQREEDETEGKKDEEAEKDKMSDKPEA
jgi:small subunit ribosomal protein S1